jgi:hypothetical protein
VTESDVDQRPDVPTAFTAHPKPEIMPEPTYWPAVTALGVVVLLWGTVTTLLLSVIGLATLALGLGGWIGDLRRAERRRAIEDER